VSRQYSDSSQASFGFGDLYPPALSDLIQSPQAHARHGLVELPLLPIRDTVLYPRLVSPLFVGRDRSVKAIEAAQVEGKNLIVAAQRDPEVEEPRPEDLYAIGCSALIIRTLRMPDGTTSVLTQGQYRAQIVEFVQTEPYFRVKARLIEESVEKSASTEALMRAVLALLEKVVNLNRSLPEDAYVYAMNIEEPGWLADLVASTIDIDLAERQQILEIFNPAARLQTLSIRLAKKLDVLELEDQIHMRVQREVDRSQREAYLREQIRAIQSELGEGDLQTQEIAELRDKVGAKNMPDEVRAKASKELDRLQQMPPMAPEVGIIRTYLDWIIDLPWSETTTDDLDVAHAGEVLDRRHYGLPKAKERILEYIAVRRLAADKQRVRSPILCFVGPPGTGKTSLGKSIAEALGRKFVRVSLGGIHDEAEIRGHRRTYIGALPGRIIQTMRRAETINPLFMLDEIDKLGVDYRGDPSAALLEALDPEQNFQFRDHYLEVPFDLSKVLFITTANVLDPVPDALHDRMEVLELPGYTEEEKIEIAKRHVIPRQVEAHGLKLEENIQFTTESLAEVIRYYTREAGLRNLERNIATICRKQARRIAEGGEKQLVVDGRAVREALGAPKMLQETEVAERTERPGVAIGLAWTPTGGDILFIEANQMPGKHGLIMTGHLGQVMQESMQAALTWVRSHSEQWDLPPDYFENRELHMHVPAGAIPKDGPSAGVTMATALVSLLTRRRVRPNLAMTGEITLSGLVLPVGGIKEKVLAAKRAGITEVLLPKQNAVHVEEDLKKEQLEGLTLRYVKTMDEVIERALEPSGRNPVSGSEYEDREPALVP